MIRLRGSIICRRHRFVIADNKLAENSGYDRKLLALELKELSLTFSFDLTLTGFELPEVTSPYIYNAGHQHMREVLDSTGAYNEFENVCVWSKTNVGMGSLYRPSVSWSSCSRTVPPGTDAQISGKGLPQFHAAMPIDWRGFSPRSIPAIKR